MQIWCHLNIGIEHPSILVSTEPWNLPPIGYQEMAAFVFYCPPYFMKIYVTENVLSQQTWQYSCREVCAASWSHIFSGEIWGWGWAKPIPLPHFVRNLSSTVVQNIVPWPGVDLSRLCSLRDIPKHFIVHFIALTFSKWQRRFFHAPLCFSAQIIVWDVLNAFSLQRNLLLKLWKTSEWDHPPIFFFF